MQKHRYLHFLWVGLYVMSMLNPVLPFLDYLQNKDYITTYLCVNRDEPRLKCDGKCHLAKELREAQNNGASDTEEIPQIELKDYPVSTLDESQDVLKAEFVDRTEPDKGNHLLTCSGYSISVFNPPEVV